MLWLLTLCLPAGNKKHSLADVTTPTHKPHLTEPTINSDLITNG